MSLMSHLLENRYIWGIGEYIWDIFGELYPQTPADILNHAPFVLNFLNLDGQGCSVAK